jgi:hypothetical protein
MPTENEKQLTAVMMLREKAIKEIDNINEDATFQTPYGLQVVLNSEQGGRIIALQQMIDSIDEQALATERQQLIDAVKYGHNDAHKVNSDLSFEEYYSQTFKTQ